MSTQCTELEKSRKLFADKLGYIKLLGGPKNGSQRVRSVEGMRGVLLWDTLSELLLPRRGFYIWRKVIISFSGIIDLFNPDYIEFLPGRRSVNKCKCVMDLQKGNVVVMTGRGRQTRTSSTRQEPREEYSLYSLYTTRYTIQWAHSTGIVYIVQITFV